MYSKYWLIHVISGTWNLVASYMYHFCDSLSTNKDTDTMQDRLYSEEIKFPANITSNESFTQGTATPKYL
jgi:hypothetical protein